MKTLAILVLGLAFLGCSTSSFSQELTVVPQHANGNSVQRAYIYHERDTQMFAFCQLMSLTEETKDIEATLMACVPMTVSTATAMTKVCIGVETPDGPYLTCNKDEMRKIIQEPQT